MMAILAFIRVLGNSGPQVDEKYSLSEPTQPILTEKIFNRISTASIIINVCGRATFLLCNLCSHADNNIDVISTLKVMWTNLFKHVKKATNIQHANLILQNVQLLLLVSFQVIYELLFIIIFDIYLNYSNFFYYNQFRIPKNKKR